MKLQTQCFFGKNLAWASFLLAVLAGTPAVGSTVLRTIAYHQITALTSPTVDTTRSPVLSADGHKIAFARPYYGDRYSNLIYTVNFDGTGLTLVDTFEPPGYHPGAGVDISADGSKVIYWVGGILRMVNSDGSNPHQVIGVGADEYRLSPDGTKVFFSVNGDFGTNPDTGSHEAGLYVATADGGALQEILGRTNMATFFGLTPPQLIPDGYLYGWNGREPFGLSGDGSKLAFIVWTPSRYRLLGINADGSGLHELALAPTPINLFNTVGLNGDGSKVFYRLSYAPCCSSGEELGVLNWDGSQRRVLLSTYSTNQSSGGYDVTFVSMNQDGSRLLFGDTSWLINTDGSGLMQLAWNGNYSKVLQWGFYHGMMSRSGTRFAFLSPVGTGDGSRLQVATAELNPTSLGAAPTLNDLSANPPYTLTNGSWGPCLLSARPTPTNSLSHGAVAVGVFTNGIQDATVNWPWMYDDGANGDAVAGDGLFQNGTIEGYSWTPIGPRVLRFEAEALGGDGMYHATAVDLAPFFVLGQAPSGPPPAITSITPSNAAPGTQITITGSGFDPIATNNVVLIGNQPAQVISGNPQGTQVVVVVPPGLPPGPVQVTISSLGQTGAPGGFTVLGTATSWLDIKLVPGTEVAAGLDVYGTTGKSYRIEYVTDLHNNSNNWVPLTNLVLPASPYRWIDSGSTNQAKRFYRSVLLP